MGHRLILIILLVATVTGCATKRIELPDGRVVSQREPMEQVGVIVTIKNNCAPRLRIESRRGIEVRYLAYGRSATIPMPSRFSMGRYGSSNRNVWVMVSAYADDAGTEYVGSVEHTYNVNTYQGTRDVPPWQVDRLSSPSGAKCPMAKR